MSALFCLFLCFRSYPEKLEVYTLAFYKIRYILEELYVAVIWVLSRLIIYIDQLNTGYEHTSEYDMVFKPDIKISILTRSNLYSEFGKSGWIMLKKSMNFFYTIFFRTHWKIPLTLTFFQKMSALCPFISSCIWGHEYCSYCKHYKTASDSLSK